MPVTFSWNLDLGQVLILIGGIGTVAAAFSAFGTQLTGLRETVREVKNEISQMKDVVISNARLDERVSAISARMTSVETQLRERDREG